MKRPAPIKDRIVQAIRDHGQYGFIKYCCLAQHVFTRDQFPRAFCSPTRGGPPGCYMPLSKAIREHGFHIHYEGGSVAASTVGYGKNRPLRPSRRAV